MYTSILSFFREHEKEKVVLKIITEKTFFAIFRPWKKCILTLTEYERENVPDQIARASETISLIKGENIGRASFAVKKSQILATWDWEF